jgi:hypothetical protein
MLRLILRMFRRLVEKNMQLPHNRRPELRKQRRQDYLRAEAVRRHQQLDLRLLLLLCHNKRSQLYLNEMLFRNLLDKDQAKE